MLEKRGFPSVEAVSVRRIELHGEFPLVAEVSGGSGNAEMLEEGRKEKGLEGTCLATPGEASEVDEFN